MTRQKTPFETWGLECGEGWAKLYEPLIKMCGDAGVVVFQIKEKFGTLRFYVDNAPPEILTAIDIAAAESAHTCEKCGEPGKLRRGGWLKTLCDAHAKEWKKGSTDVA